MSTREARGRQLLRDKESEFHVFGNTRMKVPSQQPSHAAYIVHLKRESGRTYDVRTAASGTCQDYLYRPSGHPCKHMIAANLYLRNHRDKRKWKF